ncbi:filamentous hemagglutinin N-terminal domain-containing protein [Trinickia sp. YCB016]
MKYRALKLTPAALAASLLLAGQAHAVGNGTIADGAGSINKNGTTTNVNQSSDKLIINWNNMDVAQGETLNFNQKNYNSAVLNRINSANATSILGALNANGRVFIVNPNGVLIGNGAKINVGSLIASSLNISDADFKDNRLNFKGGGNGDVVNQGDIKANESVALIGSKTVSNTGSITSTGNVALAAGDAITLQFSDAGLSATVTEGSLKALINNGGLLSTQDGDIVLTAWARDSLVRSVINNTGTIEAMKPTRGAFSNGSVTLQSLGNGEVTVGGNIRSYQQRGGVNVSGAKITQLEGAKTSGNSVTFDAGTTGDVALSGETTANQGTTIKGKNVKLDGAINTGNLYIKADRASSTARSKTTASKATLSGGTFDLSQGDNSIYSTVLDADSADLAYGEDYASVTGGVRGDLRVRGKGDVNLQNLWVDGKLTAAAQKDLTYSDLGKIGGDVLLSGKNVRGITGTGGLTSDDSIETDGSVTVNADENVKTGKITAKGNVNISAGKDVKTGVVTGKAIDLRAENGVLDVYGFKSTEDAYLKGGTSIHVGSRSSAGKNLTFESQGDVTLENGVDVGGDLKYKLGDNSKVENKGQANDVKGTTTGQPGQTDDNKPDDNAKPDDNKPDDNAKPDDNKPDDNAKPDDNKPDDNTKPWTAEEEAKFIDWAKTATKGDLEDSLQNWQTQLADLKKQSAAETDQARKQSLETQIDRLTKQIALTKTELANRQAEEDKKKKADDDKKKAADDAKRVKDALDALIKQLQNIIKSIFSFFGWR